MSFYNKISLLILIHLSINSISPSIPIRIPSNVTYTLNRLVAKFSLIHSNEYPKRINSFRTPFHTLPLEAIISSPYFGTKLTTNNKLLEISKCNICEAIVEAVKIEFNREGMYFYLIKLIEHQIIITYTFNIWNNICRFY